MTRQMLRLMLPLILTAMLVSCGSEDSGVSTTKLSSSTEYGERSLAADDVSSFTQYGEQGLAVDDINGTILDLAESGNSSDISSDVVVSTTALVSSAVLGGHSAAINTSGRLYAWGANGYGQLGNGSRLNKSTPVAVQGSIAATSFAIGGAHNVALANNGTVWAWGLNNYGQLGDNSLTTRITPVQTKNSLGQAITGIVSVAAAGYHTLALKDNGIVLAWGRNNKGQLGDGTTTYRSAPVLVAISNVVAIAAGGEFSMALKADGSVWAWGSNIMGQLGDNSVKNSLLPVQVKLLLIDSIGNVSYPPLYGIKNIAAGGSHALALAEDGTVWAWGYNEFGQLGDGTTTSSKVAIMVTLPNDVTGAPTAISAGLDHSLVVIGGGVYACGYKKYGQLGDGSILGSDTPVKNLRKVVRQDSTPLTDIVSVTATGFHSLARDVNGHIWSWGHNLYGQLGNGTTISYSRARTVLGL